MWKKVFMPSTGKANFLLLDEPTNHLDMHSVELLAEALNKYEGSYILVSHDRYFISKTANKIWEIVDNKIREFKGTYTEYVDWKERKEKQEAADKKLEGMESKTAVVKVEPLPAKKAQGTISQPSAHAKPQQSLVNHASKNELIKLQKQFARLEEDINKLNTEKTRLEAELGKPENYSDKNSFIQLEQAYKTSQQKIASANKEYETLFEKIMQLETA